MQMHLSSLYSSLYVPLHSAAKVLEHGGSPLHSQDTAQRQELSRSWYETQINKHPDAQSRRCSVSKAVKKLERDSDRKVATVAHDWNRSKDRVQSWARWRNSR